jgi:hypothetical protein
MFEKEGGQDFEPQVYSNMQSANQRLNAIFAEVSLLDISANASLHSHNSDALEGGFSNPFAAKVRIMQENTLEAPQRKYDGQAGMNFMQTDAERGSLANLQHISQRFGLQPGIVAAQQGQHQTEGYYANSYGRDVDINFQGNYFAKPIMGTISSHRDSYRSSTSGSMVGSKAYRPITHNITKHRRSEQVQETHQVNDPINRETKQQPVVEFGQSSMGRPTAEFNITSFQPLSQAQLGHSFQKQQSYRPQDAISHPQNMNSQSLWQQLGANQTHQGNKAADQRSTSITRTGQGSPLRARPAEASFMNMPPLVMNHEPGASFISFNSEGNIDLGNFNFINNEQKILDDFVNNESAIDHTAYQSLESVFERKNVSTTIKDSQPVEPKNEPKSPKVDASRAYQADQPYGLTPITKLSPPIEKLGAAFFQKPAEIGTSSPLYSQICSQLIINHTPTPRGESLSSARGAIQQRSHSETRNLSTREVIQPKTVDFIQNAMKRPEPNQQGILIQTAQTPRTLIKDHLPFEGIPQQVPSSPRPDNNKVNLNKIVFQQPEQFQPPKVSGALGAYELNPPGNQSSMQRLQSHQSHPRSESFERQAFDQQIRTPTLNTQERNRVSSVAPITISSRQPQPSFLNYFSGLDQFNQPVNTYQPLGTKTQNSSSENNQFSNNLQFKSPTLNRHSQNEGFPSDKVTDTPHVHLRSESPRINPLQSRLKSESSYPLPSSNSYFPAEPGQHQGNTDKATTQTRFGKESYVRSASILPNPQFRAGTGAQTQVSNDPFLNNANRPDLKMEYGSKISEPSNPRLEVEPERTPGASTAGTLRRIASTQAILPGLTSAKLDQANVHLSEGTGQHLRSISLLEGKHSLLQSTNLSTINMRTQPMQELRNQDNYSSEASVLVNSRSFIETYFDHCLNKEADLRVGAKRKPFALMIAKNISESDLKIEEKKQMKERIRENRASACFSEEELYSKKIQNLFNTELSSVLTHRFGITREMILDPSNRPSNLIEHLLLIANSASIFRTKVLIRRLIGLLKALLAFKDLRETGDYDRKSFTIEFLYLTVGPSETKINPSLAFFVKIQSTGPMRDSNIGWFGEENLDLVTKQYFKDKSEYNNQNTLEFLKAIINFKKKLSLSHPAKFVRGR